MRLFIIGLISILIVNCTLIQKERDYLKDWELFSQLAINIDTSDTVEQKLGKPTKIKKISEVKKEEQWEYMRNGIPKILLLFAGDRLQVISMSIWEEEVIVSPAYLLRRFKDTNWTIAQEEKVSPHYMPTMCYLTNEKQGIRIEVHGYKKIAESIYKWNPKVITPDMKKSTKLNHDYCAWLKDL